MSCTCPEYSMPPPGLPPRRLPDRATFLVALIVVASLFVCLTGRATAQSRPGAADTVAQRTLACAACHGKEGRATRDGYFPRIAGKPAGYLYNQLLNFREGRRRYPQMTYMVAHLSDAYLMEMAEHFASLDLPYPPAQTASASADMLARGRTLVLDGDRARKLPACTACHSEKLTGMQPTIPGLLGLSRDYLNAQFGAWRSGMRHAAAPDCMADISRKLTPEDIGAVSAWLASQPLPANMKAQPSTSTKLPMRCGSFPQ